MSIKINLDRIKDEYKEELIEALTVEKENPMLEYMKKIGKINPGYGTDPNSKIYTFNVDDDKNLWVPYHYARSELGLPPKEDEEYGFLPENVEFKAQLRDHQIEVCNTGLGHLEEYGTTTIGLPPGYGKTFIGSFLSFKLNLKTIIIVPRSTLLTQWEKTFNAAIPLAKTWIVDVKKLPEEIPDIFICLDPRIEKIPIEWKNTIGTLILDEAHMLPTVSKIKNILSIHPRYIIMESATMERNDGLIKICHLIGGKHGIFKIAKDFYTVKVINIPVIDVPETRNHIGINYGDLCKKISDNDLYNHIILNIVKTNFDNKFIILTKYVEHAKRLKALFANNEIESDILVGTKKDYVDSRILIGTFPKIGTGFDESSFSSTFKGVKSDSLIICHSVKETKQFEQFRGRVMRVSNPTVYWMNVKNKLIRRHLGGLKKHILETNGKIENVSYENYI